MDRYPTPGCAQRRNLHMDRLCLTGLLLTLFIIIYLWRNSNRQKGLRTLKALQKDLHVSKDLKKIPFQLSNAFKLCFNVKNINHISMHEKNSWDEFKHKLETECFSKEKPQQSELEKLVLEARHWLKQQATKNG